MNTQPASLAPTHGGVWHSAITASLLLLALPLAPGAASALPSGITIMSTARAIQADGVSFCPGCGPMGEDEVFSNGDADSTNEMGLFDSQVGSVGSAAYQTSIVIPTMIAGEGGIGLGSTGQNSASSTLGVVFEVDATATYGIQGEFTSAGFGGFIFDYFVAVTSPSGDVFRETGFAGGSFSDSFVLEAGTTYTLSASVGGEDFSGFGESASWSLTMVPEPSTGLLLGFGVVLLAHQRRRRTGLAHREPAHPFHPLLGVDRTA